jgi:hypothetical protein
MISAFETTTCSTFGSTSVVEPRRKTTGTMANRARWSQLVGYFEQHSVVRCEQLVNVSGSGHRTAQLTVHKCASYLRPVDSTPTADQSLSRRRSINGERHPTDNQRMIRSCEAPRIDGYGVRTTIGKGNDEVERAFTTVCLTSYVLHHVE